MTSWWFQLSTHLKNIRQNGNLAQVGVKIKNIWNHHLDELEYMLWTQSNVLHVHLFLGKAVGQEEQAESLALQYLQQYDQSVSWLHSVHVTANQCRLPNCRTSQGTNRYRPHPRQITTDLSKGQINEAVSQFLTRTKSHTMQKSKQQK